MTDLVSLLTSIPGHRWISIIKLLTAGGGAIVLLWGITDGQSVPDRATRWRDGVLALLGLVAFGCWWNFGTFGGTRFVHTHEQYHYYIGAKYFPEIGYTRLYQCTAVADIEAGLAAQVGRAWIRNLETNELELGETVFGHQQDCTRHFTPERWLAFKSDIAWFRRQRTPELWVGSRSDHGYNAPPVWAIVATPLATATVASDRSILALALIDPVLLALTFAAIWWAFGWRAMCVALIWWGTNYPARFNWTGGGFLRADWLLLSVLGLCLMKKGRPAAAGAALTYASLLRIFPAFLVAGLMIKVIAEMWRGRRLVLAPTYRHFALGAIAAMLILIPASLVVAGGSVASGVGAWRGFVANTRKHLETPLTNNVGLMAVVAYDRSSTTETLSGFGLDTPWDTWGVARRRVMAQRRPIQWILLVAFIALLARAVRGYEDWVALALGIGLIPFATQLTSYYYAVLLGYGVLLLHSRLSAVLLCAAAAVTLILPPILGVADDLHAAFSLLIIGYVVSVTALFACTDRSISKS